MRPPQLPTGAVVAGHRVVSLLGEGSTGAVYLAEPEGGGERVALKLLGPAAKSLYDVETPAMATYLSDTMLGFHGREAASVVAAYDFGGRSCVVDVGGSTGNLLATIMRAHPTLSGVLFDLPGMAAEADKRLAAAGARDRCSIVSGSFFDAVPEGGDTYVLSHVLHDWKDDEAGAILANCRRAMRQGGHLLIVEELTGWDAPSAALHQAPEAACAPPRREGVDHNVPGVGEELLYSWVACLPMPATTSSISGSSGRR